MANFNTGATASSANLTTCAITIPAGVLANDVMLLSVTVFAETATVPTLSFSGGGGGWSPVPLAVGVNPAVSASSTIWSYQYVYYRVATAGDPGATLTVTETGQAAATTWFALELAAYTGFFTASPIDVAGSSAVNPGNTGNTIVTPSLSTQRPSSWPVFTMGGGLNAGATVTYSTGGTTQREFIDSGAGIGGAIYDAGGSVTQGAAVGGGTFTSTGGNGWFGAFTIALATQAVPVTVPSAVPPRIPHPLWHELLEVAAARADWQAQGVASLAPFTWRLMDGVNGRPGNGPGTANGASGTVVLGNSFYTSAGGSWLQGYWWWVCPAGGQSTAPQTFCTYSIVNGGGQVVPGSTVTSASLVAGWNFVPLQQPLQIAIGGQYQAVTGLTGPYPAVANQFNAGGPYQGGITNGPLSCFSDDNGTNTAPYGFGNCAIATATSTDPTLTQPGTDSGANVFLDVQITNVAPAGYQGSYRLWPNMKDSSYTTGADANVNYVVGTDVVTSEPVVINAVWYYVAAGQGATGNQWATSADVWNVRTGVRVATQPNPTWINPWTGGVDQQSNNGRWVYTQMPGAPIVLPAGEWYVTVYNGNATPNAWGAKDLGYWQACGNGGGRGPDTGTYRTTPFGKNGIRSGPLFAPTTPAAPDIPDYVNPAISAPGQSVFAVGPPNQFPNRYVGTPTALFQNYMVDLEATRASVFFASAPTGPPQIPHPLFFQLLEEAAYRMRPGSAGSAATAISAGPATGTGAALSPVAQVTVTAGLATGAGAALAPVAQATAPAGLATGTGAALAPVVTVTANAGLATSAGTSQPPVPVATVSAGLATGAGAALGPVASTTPAAGLAAGAGTALSPVPVVTVFAGLATGAGAALNAMVSTSSNTTANAGLATGTGIAQPPVAQVTALAGLATGTGAALAPVAQDTALAGLASGAGAALGPVPVVIVSAGLATGAGAALSPSVTTSGNTTATAGLASGSAAALGPVPQVTALAGLASGAGAALGALPVTIPALASGTGAALAPAVVVVALARLATGTGAALAASGQGTAAIVKGFSTGPGVTEGAGMTTTVTESATTTSTVINVVSSQPSVS